jgi:hypothetical protein
LASSSHTRKGGSSLSLDAAYDELVAIDETELSRAREHPRGTERRTLLRYREALNDRAAYARLGVADRDVIVRWVEIRRLLKERHELDHDASNLADPLLPYTALRAVVVEGEARAAGVEPRDDGGDLREVVRRIRGVGAGA